MFREINPNFSLRGIIIGLFSERINQPGGFYQPSLKKKTNQSALGGVK